MSASTLLALISAIQELSPTTVPIIILPVVLLAAVIEVIFLKTRVPSIALPFVPLMTSLIVFPSISMPFIVKLLLVSFSEHSTLILAFK